MPGQTPRHGLSGSVVSTCAICQGDKLRFSHYRIPMKDAKPLLVLWSKAAVTAVSSEISALQSKIAEQASDVASQTREWFLHAVRGDGQGMYYLCTGNELEDKYKIFVQTARYKPMAPIRDDHPDLGRSGEVFKYPEMSRKPDKEVFAAFEDWAASEKSCSVQATDISQTSRPKLRPAA